MSQLTFETDSFTCNLLSNLKRLLWLSLAAIVLANLTACTPPTDEERVARLNRRVAPEGHFTNTHFIVSWPAIKGKGHVDAQPLQLKIPLEYLPYQAYLKEPKANPVLRRNISMNTYRIKGGNIDSVGIKVTYDAKPLQLRPTKQYTDEEWARYREDKQKKDEGTKRNMGSFKVRIFRGGDKGFHTLALENEKNGMNDGFYDRYFGNTSEHKRKFQVYWDFHGHKVVLYGVVAPAEYHPNEQYSDSEETIFPIDKTNPYYRHTELEDWPDIAIPVRDLLESFVVQD